MKSLKSVAMWSMAASQEMGRICDAADPGGINPSSIIFQYSALSVRRKRPRMRCGTSPAATGAPSWTSSARPAATTPPPKVAAS